MYSLKKFVETVTHSANTRGKIVASTETTLSVATRSGVVVVPRDPVSLYAVGDEVKMANGALSGRVRDTSSLPVYYV